MPEASRLSAVVLQHAIAQAEAPTTDELTRRTSTAAAEIAATATDPEPLLQLLAAHHTTCWQRLTTLVELRELASADPLTGLRHHRPLADRLADCLMAGIAVLVIDIDSFKGINDTRGHPAGDRVLVSLARAMQGSLRAEDELYRVGGDEFVVLARLPDSAAAKQLARQLCDAARRVGLTISVGLAVGAAGEPATSVLHRADQALYAAKRAGRDTVQIAR